MPRKPYTEAQVTMGICFATMSGWDFSYLRRKEWIIWSAKYRHCDTCPAGEFEPCYNMTDINKGKQNPRVNKLPHDNRVDWERLLQGLKDRGYYRPVFESQVRKQVR